MQHNTETVRVYVSGMTCTGCQNRIEKKLNRLGGVKSAIVSYRAGSAEITYDPETISLKQIKAAIEMLGYTVLQKERAAPVSKTAGIIAVILLLFMLLHCFGVLNLLVPARLADSSMGFGMLFVVGLMTSVHCVAMCGGINLSQCLPQTNASAQKSGCPAALFPALMYNLGRVISYTATGFLLGWIGMLTGITDAGISMLLQGILKIAAGIFMIAMGLGMLDLFPYLRKFSVHLPRGLGKNIEKAKSRSKRPLIVGLLNGFMPCGPLQSMQIIALASANPLIGAASMLMFSLGTVPLMLGFGSLAAALGKKFTHSVTTVGSVFVVVLGLSMLSQGGNLSGLFSFSHLLAVVIALSLVGVVSVLPYRKERARAICTALSACACVLVFTVYSACAGHISGKTAADNAKIIDGVQVVYSTLRSGNYPDITVKAGIPLRWIINAPDGSINGCNNRLMIREYGIEYSFQTGENIIEFTPDQAGTFTYSCWMGMIYGNIVVTE